MYKELKLYKKTTTQLKKENSNKPNKKKQKPQTNKIKQTKKSNKNPNKKIPPLSGLKKKTCF